MLTMARGDECKTTNKANNACKSFGITAPINKSMMAKTSAGQAPKKNEPQKNYGSWGPIFKDKKTFTDMHLC